MLLLNRSGQYHEIFTFRRLIFILYLLLIPANRIIASLAGQVEIRAYLPPTSAAILVALSVVLTLIGGIIPARAAARRDPVAALRTE